MPVAADAAGAAWRALALGPTVGWGTAPVGVSVVIIALCRYTPTAMLAAGFVLLLDGMADEGAAVTRSAALVGRASLATPAINDGRRACARAILSLVPK